MTQYTYPFPKADITTDSVVFSRTQQGKSSLLTVLLIQRGREGEPFYGFWALPGGYLNMDEDLDTCAARELLEETGLRVKLRQFHTFGAPSRDPRGRVVTVAYWGYTENVESLKAGDDAKAAQWVTLKEALHIPLAFDHREILVAGVKAFKASLLTSDNPEELDGHEKSDLALSLYYQCNAFSLDATRQVRTAYTDYPILELCDEPGQPAPIREVYVVSYDGDKYVTIRAEGVTVSVKRSYVYSASGRRPDATPVSDEFLAGLPRRLPDEGTEQ